jgi:hypothetical protein
MLDASFAGESNETKITDDTLDSVCLDVCCGTGTIGICVAAGSNHDSSSIGPKSHSVIGVDLCAPAIDDAWKNASRNGIMPIIPRFGLGQSEAAAPIETTSQIGKSYFICARAEALMEGILNNSGWRGCNGAPDNGSGLSLDEQSILRNELSLLRTFVSGKRLHAIVDPPREVRNIVVVVIMIIYI